MRETSRTYDFESVTAELDRRRFISMGFERIEALLAALGNPEKSLRVVQVVGTNGKGTTSVALSAALEIAGETTGTYLSPHVVSYAERVRLRGEQVSEEAFASAMGEVISVADERRIEVTQFELLTAGALSMFRDAGVTRAVMEAGLGARYDATTISRPEAVVLTNVALDHTEYLGETIEEIAAEKLASVPQGGTLVVGSNDPVVVDLSRRVTEKRGANLVLAGDALSRLSHLPGVRRLAPYAALDVALGLRAAETLTGRDLDDREAKSVALRVAGELPGRFQETELDGVPVILDGGHNPDGISSTLRAVEAAYPGCEIGVVFGVLQEKDVASMLEEVSRRASHLALTMPDNPRAADPEEVSRLASPLRSGGEIVVRRDVGEGMDEAVRAVGGVGGVVLVTGSLSMVATALARVPGGGR